MNRTKETDALLATIVSCAVRTAGRAFWWADLRDLEGEAWVAALQVVQKYDPTKGKIQFTTWVSTSVAQHLRTWAEAARGPVKQRAGVKQVVIERAPLYEAHGVVGGGGTPEELLAEAEAAHHRQRAIKQALRTADPDRFAAPVLRGEARPAEVAAKRGVPVAVVYKATTKARAALRTNRKLAALAEAA